MYTAPGENLGLDLYQNAGEQFGDGWWGDRWKDVQKTATKVGKAATKAAKKAQSSAIVRELEKKAVQKGADVLRGAAEVATDGLADTALTAVGMPEFAPLVDKAIDAGAKKLEKKGVDYVDQQIDKSGKWAGNGHVRYMSAGSGMRLAGGATQVGRGLRLAGSGHIHYGSGHTDYGMEGGWAKEAATVTANYWKDKLSGSGMRLAGSGMRLAGSGMYVPSLVEGSGCACH